jgi:glycolate oxidase FAD binding subunit
VGKLIRPAAEWELQALLTEASRRRSKIEVIGGGTKRSIGRVAAADDTITTTSLKGVSLYEPTELVMSAGAGTPLADIEAMLDQRGQMLAFEPIDLGRAIGEPARAGTIGAVFMTNLSGPRRIALGAARDHLLGLRAVTGNGDVIKSGGRVMKNVTGIDVARGLCGSWGTLAVATEVTFKVLPKPEETTTLAVFGQSDEIGVEALSLALGAPQEVTGTAHLQAAVMARLSNPSLANLAKSMTAIRIETFSRFLAARIEKLTTVLRPYGDVHVLADAQSRQFWGDLTTLQVMPDGPSALWRISVPSQIGPEFVRAISRIFPCAAVYDWSGGLIWLEVTDTADGGATDIRRLVSRVTGHATLVRAAPSIRAAVDTFQPLDTGLDRITRQLKATFDPNGVLNPGRMFAGV